MAVDPADRTDPAEPADPAALAAQLEAVGYLPDPGLATACLLAMQLHRPLLLDGEPGVGKTALAQATGAELIRLQCYDGIDAGKALDNWVFPRQMLHLRAVRTAGITDQQVLEASLFDERFPARPGRYWRRCAAPVRCCSSMSLTGPTTTARPSCWSSSPTTRSASPSSVRYRRRTRRRGRVVLQPDAGPARLARAPLPLSLAGAARLRPGAGDPSPAAPRGQRDADLRRRPRWRPAAHGGARQATGNSGVLDWLAALHHLGARRLEPQLAAATFGAVLRYREDNPRDANSELLTSLAG